MEELRRRISRQSIINELGIECDTDVNADMAIN